MSYWVDSFELSEINGSRNESVTRDSTTASVQLVGSWNDRYDIEAELEFSPYPPAPHLICDSIQIQPYIQEEFVEGTTNEYYSYTKALFNVSYSVPSTGEEETIDEEGNTITFTESLEPTFEMQELDFHDFKWSGGSQMKEKEAPAKLIPSMTITRTYSGLYFLPSWYYTLLGSCNQNIWYDAFLNKSFPVETLMLAASSASKTVERKFTRTTQQTDDKKWNLTIKLMYRKDGWNKFTKAGSTEPQEILYASSGQTYKIYRTLPWNFT